MPVTPPPTTVTPPAAIQADKNDDNNEPQSSKRPAFLQRYFDRFKPTASLPARVSNSHIGFTILGATCGFLSLYIPAQLLAQMDALYLIGPFGSTTALLFGSPDVRDSQPRNVIGGHILSAFVGVAVAKLATAFALSVWVAAPLAVMGSVIVMQSTKCFHPAGAATCVLAVVGSGALKDLGFWFALAPIGTGCTTLVLSAVIINNLIPGRQYPKYWW
jgi:CBS-domain-containing membrane protein